MKKNKLFCILTMHLLFAVGHAQLPAQQWINRYDGVGDYTDAYNCVATDASGNIFLAGYTVSTNLRKDYLLVKLDVNGNTLWTKTYNGLGNKDDEVLALVLDLNGNAFITGYSRGNNTGDDIVTMKYDAGGNLLWSVTYNAVSNENDAGNAIALDGFGNVIVTGQSDIDGSSIDNDNMVTIKYSTIGAQLWVANFNGTGNNRDQGEKVMVSPAGNVYVTGRSSNGSDDDIVTIKYDASGTPQWTKIYDRVVDDRPYDLKMDATENVYVAGRCNNGLDDDMVVLKYSATGAELWANGVVYAGAAGGDDRAYSLALDGAGNVFITGRTDTDNSTNISYDYCTLKFNGSGVLQWTKTYNGTGNKDDEAAMLTLDASGNVFVTGRSDVSGGLVSDYSIRTIAYSSSGIELWTQSFQGATGMDDEGLCLTIHPAGNIIVAGKSENTAGQASAVVVNYPNSGGQPVWSKVYDGSGDNSDNINALVVDNQGNSYVAGYTYSKNNLRDMLVMKLSAAGDTLWTRTYNGTDNNTDEATDIKVDLQGNVYVTGYSKESVTDYDVTTIKYSSSGTQLWLVQYNYTAVNGDDRGMKLELDNIGNLYVCGTSDSDLSAITNNDYLLIKYNTSGSQLWAVRYNGLGNLDDEPADMAYLSSGKIVVTGRSENGIDDDYVTICYNNSGAQQWLQTYNGLSGDDRPEDLFVNINELIAVTGRKFNGIDNDIATILYTNTGNQNWVHVYTVGANDEKGEATAIDYQGNVFVAGSSSNGVQNNIIAYRINANGTQSWTNTYAGAAGLDDVSTDLMIDGIGCLIVAGETTVQGTNNAHTDFFLRKYTGTGGIIWTYTYDNQVQGDDGINCIARDASNNLYLAGNSYSVGGQKDATVVKIDSPVSLEELAINHNTNAAPNPFVEGTCISLVDFENKECIFECYNLQGEQVRQGIIHFGTYYLERKDLKAGMYFFRILDEGEIIGSGKLIAE